MTPRLSPNTSSKICPSCLYLISIFHPTQPKSCDYFECESSFRLLESIENCSGCQPTRIWPRGPNPITRMIVIFWCQTPPHFLIFAFCIFMLFLDFFLQCSRKEQSSQLAVHIQPLGAMSKIPFDSHYISSTIICSPMLQVGAPVQRKMAHSCQFSHLHLNQCLKAPVSTVNF